MSSGVSGGGMWNREVSNQERNAAISKLYPIMVLGEGSPDAVTRSTELATKFELHVFTSTATKEEYLSLILSRMQQVQQRKRPSNDEGPPNVGAGNTTMVGAGNSAAASTSTAPSNFTPATPTKLPSDPPQSTLSEADRIVIQQTVSKLQPLLIPIETLIQAAVKNQSIDVELVRKMANLRSILQKQLSLLPTRVYILNAATAITLEEQIQGCMIALKNALSQQKNPLITRRNAGALPRRRLATSKSSSDIKLEAFEDSLLQHLRNTRKDTTRISGDSKPLEQRECYRFSRNEEGFSSLKNEAQALMSLYGPELSITLQQCPNGYSCMIMMAEHRLHLLLSSKQPSDPSLDAFVITPASIATSKPSVEWILFDAIQRGSLRIFPPVSLSALINIFVHFCNHPEVLR